MDVVYKEILDGRTLLEPRRPLCAHVGRYFNAMRNFFIDVSLHNGDLCLSFMGRERDTFKLAPYGDDSFFWFLTHNEAAALARYDGYGSDFFILKFGNCSGHGDNIDRLW